MSLPSLLKQCWIVSARSETWSDPKKLDKNSTQKLFKQLKGFAGSWQEVFILNMRVLQTCCWILQQNGICYVWKELIDVPNIKPISDLRNYSEVLHDVAVGAPVFLTKNGRERYAIVDMQDYEKTQATIRLMNELAKGRHSGETEGWLTTDDMRAHFRAKANEE